ncbi:hypothetical protein [Sporosarcina psychrophila]|uniref:Uncharacterized protein n=1 Tax=Sporosarcina psychrophila TaxID=1476 RepID=A0ABV2KBY2_SPOPS
MTKVDMLDVLDIYEAAELTAYLIELYELFRGTDVSLLSDYVIDTMLEQEGHTYPDEYTRRNTDKYAVSFCVTDYDTTIVIDYESNVTVEYIADSTTEEVTIVKCDGKEFAVNVIDLND